MTGHTLGHTLRATGKVVPEDARRHNRALVLQSLFTEGQASRADLARATGLTRVTISDLVAELLDEGWVEELGTRAGQRVGKPATLVGVVPDAAHIVTIDLSDDERVHGAVVDLGGKILSRRSLPRRGRVGDAAQTLVLKLAGELIAATDRPILGVGVGSPGVVSPAGVVIEAPNLGWTQRPLAADLTAALQVPVHVANDANAAALGEHSYGTDEGPGLLVITIGQGVGAGVVLDGALVLGDRYAAGELGHVVVDERGAPCACGRVGCLETVLSAHVLRDRTAGVDGPARTKILTSAGRKLGLALAPVVSTLNVRAVVLCGPAELVDGPLRAAALDTIQRRTMPVVGDEVDVRLSELGEDAALLGGAVLVLSRELGVS